MPTLTISCPEVACSVTPDRFDAEGPGRGRWVYRYVILVDPAGDAYTISGDDLASGTVTDDVAPELAATLGSLLSFAEHGAEQYGHSLRNGGEGSDWSFPIADSERLYQVADELTMLALDLAGSDDA